MITGYLFIHVPVSTNGGLRCGCTREEMAAGHGIDCRLRGRLTSPEVSATTLNGTNRVFHRDPTCSGRGNPRDGVILVVAAPVNPKRREAYLTEGKATVRECRHCHGYRSPYEADDSWRDDAACRTEDPSLWFSVVQSDREKAAAICSTCPVAGACLKYALEARQEFGLWGGLDEETRIGHAGRQASDFLWEEYADLRLDLSIEEVPT